MCGICGFLVSEQNKSPNLADLLKKMTDCLAHRGPDCEGHFNEIDLQTNIGLGHRRLSVIDLSQNATQPMGNEDDSVIIVFNGEIFNYQELKRELVAKGHYFKTQSDTEVIVHLYEELDDQCVTQLSGMFAFALLDKKKNKLLLARDRMGIKPLFYSLKGENFYFASEIKALLLVDEVSRDIDLKALDAYFTFGYIPGPRTIFKDVKKLPPATYMTFADKLLDIISYWSIKYEPKFLESEDELKAEFISLFKHSVERHLVSDVPIGAFLSGGMDSSIIVALMNQVSDKRVNTFSLGYSNGGQDELEFAAEVAQYYNTNHTEFRTNPEMTSILPELLWHLDEPFFDNSIIPTYYISKLARENVKVVLSGDGGDEIFGGYEWTRRSQYQHAFSLATRPLQKLLANSSPKTTLKLNNEYGNDLISKVKRFGHDLNSDLETGFRRRTTVSYPFRQALYSDSLKHDLKRFNAGEYQHNLFLQAPVKDDREKMLYVDTMSFLPDDCLFKVDRMSMAHGLEVRVPFLDTELVEFSARIPFHYKLRGLTSKYILKRAFGPILPKKILRQRKQGFTIPISTWLRNDLQDLAINLLLGESLERRGLFNRNYISWMLDEHANGKQEFGHRIWSLVIFEVWARLYLDEKVSSTPDVTLNQLAA
jgi:asparagine synthase (glutamine-hydrolysing)